MTSFTSRLLARVLTLLVASSSLAVAHPGHEGDHDLTWSFIGGVLHPILGLDHLIALVALGFWAARLGGAARWIVPAILAFMMTLGALINLGEGSFPLVEQVIAASLLVLGLLLVFRRRLPLAAGIVATALFANFHGLAHGGEIPAQAGSLPYLAGFLVSTVSLNSIGLALGQTGLAGERWLTNTAGGAISATGLLLLVR